MKILELGDINSKGRYNGAREPIEGEYIGFAIGPDSLVDIVKIGGHTLTAGRVLPVRISGVPNVEPVRSLFTKEPEDPQAVNGAFQINTRCQLIGYECGDELVLPGPRAPVLREATFAAGAGWTRVLRLPFAGRSMAQFGIAQLSLPGDGLTDAYRVYGVRYIQRARLFSIFATGADSQSFHVPLGNGTYFFAPDADSGVDGDSVPTVFYVGGTNDGESWDELQVWVDTPSVSGYVWGEAYDRASAGAF